MSQPEALSEQARRTLKRLAHQRKPVVLTGAAGLTSAVIAEIENALDHHELIKVRLSGADRGERDAMAADISLKTGAWLIQRLGAVGTFYRENADQPKVSRNLEHSDEIAHRRPRHYS